MKRIYLVLLAASLAVNLWFAVAVFDRENHSAPVHPAPPPVTRQESALKPDAETWPGLAGADDDLPGLVARLRASGFPADMVRAVLAGRISDAFAARRKALAAPTSNLPFWKDQPRDPQRQLALNQLYREQDKLLRELLGPDADSKDPMERLYQNQSLNFLPAEKISGVREIMRDFNGRRSDLYTLGYSNNTDRAKMDAIDQEQRATLSSLLTPAELAEYDLRTSKTANILRDELSAFEPTEAEFRAIYQLRAPFDAAAGPDFGLTFTPEQQRQRVEAQKQLAAQIKTALGEPRGSEYERDIDFNFRRTSQLVARLELPPENTLALWSVQKEFEQRRLEIAKAGGMSREQMNAVMSTLAEEATARLAPLLGGSQGVETYRQFGGTWLQSLQPRPAPAAPRN